MKKLIKKFLFWFVLIGIIINIYNLTGNDDKNIILIGLNPLLNLIEGNRTIREFIKSNGFFLWNILSMLSFILYGLLLDFIIHKKSK